MHKIEDNMEVYKPKDSNEKIVKNIVIAAHKDDGEMIGIKAIDDSFKKDESMVMIILTNGSGCPRVGEFKSVSDEDMVEIRTAEQKRAAEIGRYNCLYLLEHSSKEVQDMHTNIKNELVEILKKYPEIENIYIHNPFDKHNTHVGACELAIAAIKELYADGALKKLSKVLGVEVWRGLDWLPDKYKVTIDTTGAEFISQNIMSVFVSQNSAKRYDEAISNRRLANATFDASHESNICTSLMYAIDLMGVVQDVNKNLSDLLTENLDLFEKELRKNL